MILFLHTFSTTLAIGIWCGMFKKVWEMVWETNDCYAYYYHEESLEGIL